MPMSSFEIIHYLSISVVGEMLVAECFIIKIRKRIEIIYQKINRINPQQQIPTLLQPQASFPILYHQCLFCWILSHA